MKKRILATLLAAVMVCALMPVTAMAADITIGEVIPYMYDEVGDFSEGLAAVKWNGKWGFIDRMGKVVIPYKYDFAYHFSEGIAAVKLDGKYGFIDKTGKEVVSYKYSDCYGYTPKFSEGLARVTLNNNKWGFIDKTGKEVVPIGKYKTVQDFSEGLAAVSINVQGVGNKYGYIDKTGKEVIPCKYDGAKNFSEGLAAVELNGKYGFISKTGKEVIPGKYDRVDSSGFHEGFAAVQLNGKWGFIDKTGKEVIPCNYQRPLDRIMTMSTAGGIERTMSFSEGLAVVRLNDYHGYVDKTGKEVVPCKYVWAEDFHGGLAVVNGSEFIDKTGKEVVSPHKYDEAYSFSEGMAAVKMSGKWGFIAIDGYVPLYLDGGSGTDYIIADSSSILNVPTNPTKPGYTFGGWYTDAALTTPWNFNNKVVNTLTLYAKWMPVSSTATTTGKSQSVISLNGNTVTLDAYTLKAANGGDVTYVKLRDIAALLENTNAKFNVDWKRGAIYVTTKTAYTTKNGGELKAISGADGSYKWNTAPVLFDGTTKALEGIVITDGNGGGHTYFKLRDLGAALGFKVDWTAQRGIFIETK